MAQIIAKEVEGFTLVCEYCNKEFGICFFTYTVQQPMCNTCTDGDEPCEECGITPSEDMRIKHVCKECEILHKIILNGESA